MGPTAAQGVSPEPPGGPADPQATMASAPCETGPGRMAVTISPAGPEGEYDVEVTARRVVDGSTWRIGVDWAEKPVRARRTAVDGTWSFSTTIAGVQAEGTEFLVYASGRLGDRGFACITGVILGQPSAGIASCGNGLEGIVVRRRSDGTIAVAAVVLAVAPEKSRWRVDLKIVGADETITVSVDDYSNRYAELVSRMTFTDLPAQPRFVMKATSRVNGAQCRLTFDPDELTGTPPPTASRRVESYLRSELVDGL